MVKVYYRLLFVALFLVVFTEAQDSSYTFNTGGYARIIALGDSPYLVDPFNITDNPAWANLYQNLLFGDIGSTKTPFSNDGTGQFAAVNFRLNDKMTLGGILSRNDFNGFAISTPDPLTKFNNGIVDQINERVGDPLVELNNNFEIFSSYNFGRTTVGAGFAFVTSTTESKPATRGRTKGKVSQYGVNIGFVSKIKNNHIIDVSATAIWPSASSEPPRVQPTEYSQSIYSVKGRFFVVANENLSFVPVIQLLTASGEAKIGDGQAVISTDLVKHKIISGGVGANYKYDDFLITCGVGFRYMSVEIPAVAGLEPKLTDTYFSLPIWNLGLEWKATDWLIGRLGYTAETGETTLENTASANSKNETIETEYVPGEVRAGIGFLFGRFSLDATINTDVIRQGFNNIGGGFGTFAYVSASFWFGKK